MISAVPIEKKQGNGVAVAIVNKRFSLCDVA